MIGECRGKASATRLGAAVVDNPKELGYGR